MLRKPYRRPHPIRRSIPALLLVASSVLALSARAQTDPAARARNQPVEPYNVVGNVYSVGASGVTVLLFVTPAGSILLDAGFPETAPLVRDNIRKLGFRMEDVKILLNSHGHFDRAGGLAQLEAWSGGSVQASERDAPLLERGGRGDAAFGDQHPYPPVHVGRRLRDGDTVSLGGTTLTAHLTPGHTPGCLTWSATIDDHGKPRRLVLAGSTTINSGVRLLDRPAYPGIAADYERAFAVLKALPCDVCLAPHAALPDASGRSGLGPRGREVTAPGPYRDYLGQTEEAMRRQLADEKVETRGARHAMPESRYFSAPASRLK